MNYVGIDIHKRCSVCAAQDERGRLFGEARMRTPTTRAPEMATEMPKLYPDAGRGISSVATGTVGVALARS